MNSEKINISGEELKKLRSLKGIKQNVVAKHLHITQQAYSKLERRQKISGVRLHAILKALDYTSEDINEVKFFLNLLSSQN